MATEDARKLFVAGLPDSITEDVLRQLFEAAGGTVVDVSLPKDRATGRSRGFGFVTLSSSEEAHSVRQSLDGSMQAGRAISVRPFSSEPPRRGEQRVEPVVSGDDRTLYVGNLPYDVTQAELEQLFSDNSAGPVVRMHLPAGPDGRPRGFGFVTLGSSDAATSAIVALRSAELRGRRLTINVAHPRGERTERSERAPADYPRPSRPPTRDNGPPERFAPEPAEADVPFESARPVEGRRARVVDTAKQKKKAKGKRRAERFEEKRSRGGGGTWQKWNDWDED
jgi:RNA recognition motif-containing protein